jgi:hypothetical protein
MTAVGVVTYLVTFNINTISRAWVRVYRKRRNRIVESMRVGVKSHSTAERRAAPPVFWDSGPAKPGPRAKDEAAVPKRIKNKWKIRAERYENACNVSGEKSEPSEWYIVLYLLYRVFRGLPICFGVLWRSLPRRQATESEDNQHTAEEGKSSISGGKTVMP